MPNKTELEAVQGVKVDLNKLDRGSYSDIRFEKVLYYLNKAFLFLVKKKYKGDDPGPGRLELNHPVLDDLRPLIKEVEIDVADGLFPNTPVPFEEDHLYYISCRMKTLCPEAPNTSGWVEGRYVKPERVYKEMESPFNTSTFDDPIVTVTNEGLIIYNEGFDLDEKLLIKYISKPPTLTGGNEEMVVEWVDEIIDVAVLMILDATEHEKRFKTQPGVNVASASE